MENFERLRPNLELCQGHGVGGKITHRLPVPPMKCRESWSIFCVVTNEDNNEEVENIDTVPRSFTMDEGTPVHEPLNSQKEARNVDNASDGVANSPPLWKENLS
jgi:hypothetical protein